MSEVSSHRIGLLEGYRWQSKKPLSMKMVPWEL